MVFRIINFLPEWIKNLWIITYKTLMSVSEGKISVIIEKFKNNILKPSFEYKFNVNEYC